MLTPLKEIFPGWAIPGQMNSILQIIFNNYTIGLLQLIKDDKAYVDSQTSEVMAEQKGTPTQSGVNSPYRNRSIEENLELFKGMKEGKYEAGTHILRAKIDMSHPNMLMRDPIMYRIMLSHHHRTANDWCIYPMYDWTHGESDYIEQISHSLVLIRV